MKYELALVLNARLEDEAKNAALEKVKGYITEFGGEITNVDDWGKKRFAYNINKMKEGFYYFIKFETETKCRTAMSDQWSPSNESRSSAHRTHRPLR